ncbi:hypothetical protein SAMN05216359_1224 [Roseateles sp. YR242]|uniref:hypothetical protein n=1 Tax=Roseateles sp. YR242 TaxID=1855305 RepID=UPI0008AC19F2|nr:hypothetical protein [Roseateles sp. YR242]SEL89069.1 hypothetical protein SAMN05216359_1224 [Roseateles sp. YR242]
MLHTPPWVRFHDAGRLHFLWEDAVRSAKDLGSEAQAAPVLRTALKIEPRARMALAVALTEWIVWRFEGLHVRSAPGAFIEAAWCATADPRYLRFFELAPVEWRGPVEGPLWCAMTHLRHAISVGVDFPRYLNDALSYLTRLAFHVQPTSGPLMAWLPLVLDRLALVYPAPPEDPLPDLFSRDLSARMGPWVAREVFDLAIPVDGNTGRAFLEETLATARREENPFLVTPEELLAAGFSGTPYELRNPRPGGRAKTLLVARDRQLPSTPTNHG